MKPESSVIFFPCRDIVETKKYYSQVLGFTVKKDLGNTVWFDCGYGYLAFVQYDDGRPLAETYVIGAKGEFYGKTIPVALLGFIRPERKFDSLAALTAQMHKDLEIARTYGMQPE